MSNDTFRSSLLTFVLNIRSLVVHLSPLQFCSTVNMSEKSPKGYQLVIKYRRS
jgi:hypothetical protein